MTFEIKFIIIILVLNTKKGEIKMAVLARPISISFDLDKDKTEEFFRLNKRGTVNKAIERMEKHLRAFKKREINKSKI